MSYNKLYYILYANNCTIKTYFLCGCKSLPKKMVRGQRAFRTFFFSFEICPFHYSHIYVYLHMILIFYTSFRNWTSVKQ